MPEPTLNTRDRLLQNSLLGLLLVLAAIHAGLNLYNIVLNAPPEKQIPWALLTLVLSAAVFVHALYVLGWRRALTLFGCAALIGFVFEYVGVTTGLIYGRYYYTDVLGPKILNEVPVIIPIAYFMSVYPCYLASNLLIRGRPICTYPKLSGLLWASLLAALLVTGWDLIMDPIMVDAVRAWVWIDGGPYFGVPFQNFFGWIWATGTIMVVYRLIETRLVLQPLGQVTRWIIAIPLLGFGLNGLTDFLVGYPVATRIIGLFSLCTPMMAGLLSLYRSPIEPEGQSPTRLN
jgi:putative membrane protein